MVVTGLVGTFIFSAGSCLGADDEAPRPHLLEKAEALPLALTDDFQFTKVLTYHNSREDNRYARSGIDPAVDFERKHRMYGAVTWLDMRERHGHYYTFFWHSKEVADVTVRLEYRQEKLGPYIQAQEINYTGVKGRQKTEFAVIGDDYQMDGRVSSWRAIIIKDNRIVGLYSSFLWN